MVNKLYDNDVYTGETNPGNNINPDKKGSIYINSQTGERWVCSNNTVNANVWTRIQDQALKQQINTINNTLEDRYLGKKERITSERIIIDGFIDAACVWRMVSARRRTIPAEANVYSAWRNENDVRNYLNPEIQSGLRRYRYMIKPKRGWLTDVTIIVYESENCYAFNTQTNVAQFMPRIGNPALVYMLDKSITDAQINNNSYWPPDKYLIGPIGADTASLQWEGPSFPSVLPNIGPMATGNLNNIPAETRIGAITTIDQLKAYLYKLQPYNRINSLAIDNNTEHHYVMRFILPHDSDFPRILITRPKPLRTMALNLRNDYADPYGSPLGGVTLQVIKREIQMS